MRNRLLSFKYAIRGIYDFIRIGTNAKIQVVAGIIAVCSGMALKITTTEWIAVILCISTVTSLEAINTAIELLADEVTTEFSNKIRKIKDIAAGAVFIAALTSIIVAALILKNHAN